ncbi:MAG: branched-chain amino acid ABC transporter permease [Alphaproteobacteria bacterium]|nr:branched-chain amino acid ABC transporter permease [Alphaproteobacteria bacterium]MBU1548542.1 branched-chain amino acid ABC transporter permease [Alphaproteobacteria bacterium]MBU2337738.1 branched-chain amino acid ABC transporter permease [Alphaproteobacteria bacterium]MBU2389875.1 branched-chain amino acid ABC transporter permease [Alphaproteobacteria bacterium]MDY6961766.1 branched-chain amino acid ABC transporter permease [Pseudomonadota bacterium]
MSDYQILVENILQLLVTGVLIGAIYGMMCVGLAMIFGIMRVINFAQGDFMMVGMYATYFVFTALGFQALFGSAIGPYLSVAAAAPAMFLFGWLIHRFLIRSVTGRRSSGMEGDGHYAQLILTLGVALILQNGAMILVGADLVSIRTPLSSEAWVLEPFGESLPALLFFNKSRVIAAILSAIVIIALWLLIQRTFLGKSLRAAADNAEAATYMGIDVDRAHRIAFALGTAVTAMAGGLLATNYPFSPFVGLEYVIIMYAGVVLGGIGSVIGAFWGGMIIGLVQQFSTLVLPTQLQNATIFVCFLLVVMLRPQGLFGRNVERT